MDYPGHGHGHGGPHQQHGHGGHGHGGHGHAHGHGEIPPEHYQDLYAGAQSLPVEYSEVHNVMVDGRDRLSVSAVAFDTQEELLWMGNQGGHVTSYYSQSMQKYTSFQVHQQNEVRQVLPMEHGILSLMQDTVRCSSRFGQTVYNFNHPAMHNMQCMIQTGATNILMGGHQTEMVEFDFNTAQELRMVQVNDPGCAILRLSSRYICTGDTSGKVTLRDPNTLKAEHVLPAHSATLSDFDVHGNLLVTCGFSNRERLNSIAVDRYIKVYDLRVMRAVAPLHTQIDPMFLRFVSPYSDKLAVVSQAGQFVMMNTATESNDSIFMYHVNTGGAPVLSFDVSTSYQSLAFGDGGGYIHLFTSSDNAVFNTYSHHPTFADPVEPLQPFQFNDEITPYGIIPMQYPAQGKMFSQYPDYLQKMVYRKPQAIDPEVLRTVKYNQNIGYAPNPGNRRRNQVQYDMGKGAGRGGGDSRGKKGVPDSPIGRGDDPFIQVPKKYRKVEIKYSKLGVEDFDFRHYNKTNFAGLETHIPNAYCNSMLQTLYFIEPLRVAMMNHLCQKESCLACELGFLFYMLDLQIGQTCQANNFLRAFRTIPEASALGLILGDQEESMGKVNYTKLIQSWNRFVLQQVFTETSKVSSGNDGGEKAPQAAVAGSEDGANSAEAKLDKDLEEIENALENFKLKTTEEKTYIERLFCTYIINTFKCRCSREMSRVSETLSFNLVYPDCSPRGPDKEPRPVLFSEVLEHTICSEQTTQAWCSNCSRYQPHTQSKIIKNLPDVLVFNCQVNTAKETDFWRIQQDLLKEQIEEMPDAEAAQILAAAGIKLCRYGRACTRKDCKFRHEINPADLENPDLDIEPRYPSWVPYGIRVKLLPNGKLEIQNRPKDLDDITADASDSIVYYDLLATIAHVTDPKTGGNLVAHIHGGDLYHQRKEKVTCTQWYLFNDFAIHPIEKYGAVYFNLDWKMPCTIYFIKTKINKYYDLKVKNPVTSDVLLEYASLVTPRRRNMTFTPLMPDEMPKEGEVVGLDAEFVTINQEEAEIRSDGTKSTIKPSQMTVARITCVRGSGPMEGAPFLDDYISTQEQVVDYLTQFSGIKPGDLDANISSKHLTTLKSTYIKLRHLLDLGVVFVGHGLKKDFRVINLVVPRNQVVDTVELFHLPRQRMISLKFLAWYFLNMNIQGVTHDSIEDARTALKLYQKHKALMAEGAEKWRDALNDLYEQGRKLQWKIPDAEEQ
ncbi:PAN2-PAN3 deadenylation complex catalytic subunit PAN2-like isoform X2 [Lineus longissimus]|uniref:PAN2-PAN3 deadenylation complex catalytic subunit PAN2-like isoform X2 n=1 Tax=Lineus longissimus TaxID=88925 RepID=UPI002B4C76B9